MSLVNPLHKAILDGDCDRIDTLLSGRDVKVEGAGLLRVALMDLTEAPDPKVIQHLIELGVEVNAKDRIGWTPLHFAVRRRSQSADPSRSTACVRLLIEAGADVNAKDNEGVTPLHRSVLSCPWNVDLIGVLLDAGAKPTDEFFRFFKAIADSPEKSAVLSLLSSGKSA